MQGALPNQPWYFVQPKETMTISYSLNEQDFLTFQLFTASSSKQVKKTRMRTRYLGLVLYLLIALICVLQKNYALSIIFVILGGLWPLLYPIYQRRRYKRFYLNFIRENYKNRFGKNVTLEINNDFLLGKDGANETKTMATELEEVNELNSLILIKLKSGQTLILPKDQIAELDQLRTRLQELASSLKIQYNIDEKWEWK